MKEAVLLFARWPVAGQVKTRLAEAVGAERAARLYQAFTDDLVETMREGPHDLIIVASPPAALPQFEGRYGVTVWPQAEGDLGTRMEKGFEAAWAAGYSRVVLIGSDIPHLPLVRVRAALTAMPSFDVVLGPSEDGGYHLVALKQPIDLWHGIAWSQPDVLHKTMARCQGRRLLLLEPTFDVDDVHDLKRLKDVRLGRHTSRALEEVLV